MAAVGADARRVAAVVSEGDEEGAAALGRVLHAPRPPVDPVGMTADDFFCDAEDLLGPPHPDRRAPYEPPRVTRVGTLRDVKAGSGHDPCGNPHPPPWCV